MKLYQSLTRPKLKRGAEWKLSTMNGLFALLLLVVGLSTWHWLPFAGAALFYWPGNWVLRAAAKHDSQWFAIYSRSLRQELIREPHGYAWTRDSKPRPIIPAPSKWVK